MDRDLPQSFCCEPMQVNLEQVCDQHASIFDCPDDLVAYSAKFREYGLIVHDGGTSVVTIEHCPWCGTALPTSVRAQYYDRLERLGLESDEAPPSMQSEAWWRDEGLETQS